ncbi:hypothetical protein [Halodesulfovibrio aestuarii]|uniref:hypothetical protein n=1 Tax=Halodesulfovibrio aestuarii TaxID=126333 RepID=UPI003D3568FC
MRQEKLIAIAFVIAALIFSTVTYSFAQRVVVMRRHVPVEYQVVDYGMYRVAPCGAVVVRPMVPGYCRAQAVPMCRRWMMVKRYGHRLPCNCRVLTHKQYATSSDLQNTAYGFKYYNEYILCTKPY